MLLAFLVCSIGLAYAEPDTTSSTLEGSSPDDDVDTGIEWFDEAIDTGRLDIDNPDETVDPPAPDTDGLEHAVDTSGLGVDVDDPGPASIDAAEAPTWAHGLDTREAALRRHMSWLGRIDVSITWRRAVNDSTAVQRDEVWLVGTWRL